MLNQETRSTIAQQIFDCFTHRRQIPLLTQSHPEIEVEDAYRIQEQVISRFQADGRQVKGYKIGLTSEVMQQMAGTTEPDYSSVLDHMFVESGSCLKCDDFSDPLIEIEIAFVMKQTLKGPGITEADVAAATDYILPSIELVDFRVARAPGMDVRDTIADLAAVGCVSLGSQPKRLDEVELGAIRGDLIINGSVQESGAAAAVLGNPLTAVAWLANKLSEFGIAFEAGDVAFSGSFVRAIPVQAGDSVIARFDSGLGDVSLQFD
ncbi:2-keto-4-pentenoate hydratase [Aestuariirhabdus litorea]|uniref:4-oxalocrotonate decarboxylase n=1 Tax=Aestuariirhabdus litorea TaxID=2528527 RepID=A0A3P3VPN4_9GAMM|nr:4-oxalocrotonate decarboxylase [Aestuariirhabdus litorea]RRJ84394.1 4-oxalocrotonate decarboxylase [Aestuariirhabdus litorea]RWW97618.1 4-oxalocrotonate decarboxylase [Endozoicomonadaceae bacterium GTF-13]